MRQFFGCVLLGLASLLLVVQIVALVDPVGTQLANDADPYGDPHRPWWFHGLWLTAVALLATAGARLTLGGGRDRDRAT